MQRVAVVMPAWNEAEGIAPFIDELGAALSEWRPIFVVVDDCSTDGTIAAVEAAGGDSRECIVSANHRNLGHGPSTVRALRIGAEQPVDVVIAVDGDGQFSGTDMAAVIRTLLTSSAWVAEGLRQERGNPLYRRLASVGTRTLVATRAGHWPTDANTPLRAYRIEALRRLLPYVPQDTMTPNLVISALTRRWSWQIVEIPVTVRPRLGESEVGTTWGKGARLPSKRFIEFCWRGAMGWFTTPLPKNPVGLPQS